jgi:hypothetical protein
MATLPPGLQLDPLTGVISGTPLAGWGPTFVSFQVTDHTGMGSEKQLLITVNPTTTTASTTTTTPNNNNSASSKSTSGLSLSLSLDSTTYQPSQQITIVIDEMNTLSSSNNVHASNDWALNGLTLNNCGIEYYPFGILIFRGYCTSSNISKATSLYFYDHIIDHGCQSIANFSDYIFTPKSDLASSVFNETIHSYTPLKYEITTNGYWPVYAAPNYNYSFSTFEPGIYTVVAGDEWGAMVILHFTVSNSVTTTTLTTPQK